MKLPGAHMEKGFCEKNNHPIYTKNCVDGHNVASDSSFVIDFCFRNFKMSRGRGDIRESAATEQQQAAGPDVDQQRGHSANI